MTWAPSGLRQVLAGLRQAWRFCFCALEGHRPTESQRVSYVGADGVAQTDEWAACRCGRKMGQLTRTRLRPPYPPV